MPAAGAISTRHVIPIWILVALLAEAAWLRAPLLGFAPGEILRTTPATVRFLEERHPGQRDFKIANVPHFYAYLGFAGASNPRLPQLLRSDLASLEAGGNLIWNLGSIHANLALPLARREAVTPLLEAEVRGSSARAPGRRLMDLLGIRYVVVHASHLKGGYAPDLVEIFRDGPTNFAILENRHASPRFQLRSGARWVDDATEAVALFAEAGGSTLLLEDSEGRSPTRSQAEAASARSRPARFDVIESAAQRYEVELELGEPAWLFIADAWYPGWEARVDGEAATLHPANALGKALLVPAGAHRVEVRFRSGSARAGAIVTAASIRAILLGLLARSLARRARETVA
jgi:hypothetical protein